ncbi:valine--tRNA ligase [Patescibacteria group bacterium]|nr:valine--tRNA ligase [Patescibacteria group bacterium]MBU4367748.1 valine--tRNA ligase [Patescibacteria group bacterium]MBU4461802.1 valine--tRNA ligase [Patescibacteria group bacterium]MCG2700067.1 valine--tRNA ligase [Candidatus Parcubacteria bacterium]
MAPEKFEYTPNTPEDISETPEIMSNTNKTEASKEKKMEEKERYNPFEKEKYWQDFWEREKVYEFDPERSGPLFTVDAPPPTISGALHLGHIFSYVQAEVIARFKRMEGSNIRYPMGFDNNGLPTERLVEKETGIRGQDVKLEEFVKSCLSATEKYKKLYESLLKSAGFSMDWRLEYSTISPEVQKLSQSVFKELYEKGLIYKENAPALYCTECHTSFAQAEKEDKEKEAAFFDLLFKIENGEDLTISTTRPELLPACAAVFVNPKDKRYTHFVGKKIKTPLGQEVTIMSDDKVDIEKGSGAVMCCTYGDETDIYWAKIYRLQERIILDKDGKLQNVDELPEINGKTAEAARKIIIEKLKEGGFVKKEEKIKHNIGVHERCSTPIEFLPTTQWFMKMLDMKENLLEAGNRINWYPPYMKKRYEEWVSGLKWDWCISRERFYGIPIPVFNCDNCENIVIPDEDCFPLDPKMQKIENSCSSCKTGKLVAERSVLDTWFTSSLTPDINSSNQLNGSLKDKLYPMSMRPIGHDIIRTWVVYSILMGLYRHNEVPWKDLMVSGHILLRKGEKISKKTGGGKHGPEELIATKSSDAVRYAMCGATLGRDAYFEDKEVEKGKKLITKIYNAGKLVLSKLQGFDPKVELQRTSLEAFDQWILQRSLETAEGMSKAFEKYEFSQARKLFEEFFWSDFCDNYLEIAKGRLSIGSDDKERATEKLSAQHAAYQSFLNILKMTSPFVPHITEEMYHADVVKKGDGENVRESIESKNDRGYFYKNEKTKSIHNTRWPVGSKHLEGELTEGAKLALLLVSEVRKVKTNKKIRFGASISLLKIKCPKNKQDILKPFLRDVSYAMRAKETIVTDSDKIKVSIEE